MTYFLRQRPIGNPDDVYSRGPVEEARVKLLGERITPPERCVGCGAVLLADAEIVEVNNIGPACSETCASQARNR